MSSEGEAASAAQEQKEGGTEPEASGTSAPARGEDPFTDAGEVRVELRGCS